MKRLILMAAVLLLLLAPAGCRRGGDPDDQVRPTPIAAPVEDAQGGGAGDSGGGIGQP